MAVLLIAVAATLVGASFYMLDYALAPEENRTDTASCYRHLFDSYPETRSWVDSLRGIQALRDTFMMMPEDSRRLHALFVRNGSGKTALILHGWRGCSVNILFLARIYEQELGYNVVIPDYHAHGLSDGNMIRMGWLDRKDMMQWVNLFQTDTMAVHGISMGGATAMMMSAETYPEGITDLRFIDDCGYTSVWDELAGELRKQFGLPEFPLMYANDLDWADVEIESGVTLKKTDDLLDYIKGNNSSIIGRIDEVELANAGYEVRCEKSVCYVGDVLKSGSLNYIPLYIYKNGTLLNGWSQISAEGITLKTPYTKPTSGNDIITFSNVG